MKVSEILEKLRREKEESIIKRMDEREHKEAVVQAMIE